MITSFTELLSQTPMTVFMISIIAVISFTALQRYRLFDFLLLYPYAISYHHQYYRLFTGDLVHQGLAHTAINLGMLYIFGAPLERRLAADGQETIFLLIYLSAMLMGSLAVTLRHRNDPLYSSAGCSGSVVGCMFSSMLMLPERIVFYAPVVGAVSNVYSGLFYLAVLGIVGWRRGDGLMNHEQHFYGALGGIVSTVAFFPKVLTGLY